MLRNSITTICILVFLSGCFGSSTPLPENKLVFEEVKPVPPVQAVSLDGSSVDLSTYKGKPVLLHFWATWCFSCIGEMRELEQLRKNPELAELQIVAVAADSMPGTVRRFMKRHGLTYTTLLDMSGSLQSLYRVTSLPTSFLISRSSSVMMFPDPDGGTPVIKLKGSRNWSSIRAQQVLRAFIAQP